MKRVMLLILALLALVVAGCGGGSSSTTTAAKPPAAAVSKNCPPGQSSMGCAVSAIPGQRSNSFAAAPHGPLFPDVFEGQGSVDWNAVAAWQRSHGWKLAGIFKLGEFRIDSQAQRNASETARLGFWRAGYWFMRNNTDTRTKANQIIAAARAFRVKIVVLDIETLDAVGSGAVAPLLRAAGLIVVIYTAPGTWPGGPNFNLPLWIATYGSSFCTTCLWTGHPVAWQFTDGQHGAITRVPGIPGTDDVSVDFGITKLGVVAVDPFAVLVKRPWKFGKDQASEYNTNATWRKNHCRVPARRVVCKTSYSHLVLLTGRLWTVAHQGKKTDWTTAHRGTRYKILSADAHQK